MNNFEEDAPSSIKANKACFVCGEEIRHTAKKCMHCHSHQSAIRRLFVNLPMLVALFSVFTLGLPLMEHMLTFLKKYPEPDRESIVVSEFTNKLDDLQVIAYNGGNIPGYLKKFVELQVIYANGETRIFNKSNYSPFLHGGHASDALKVTSDSEKRYYINGLRDYKIEKTNPEKCKLSYQVLNLADRSERQSSFAFKCMY